MLSQFQDRYSCASTVWAFAVTLWEILSFCCERPFSNLSNEKVIQNAEHMYYGGELQVSKIVSGIHRIPVAAHQVTQVMHLCTYNNRLCKFCSVSKDKNARFIFIVQFIKISNVIIVLKRMALNTFSHKQCFH